MRLQIGSATAFCLAQSQLDSFTKVAVSIVPSAKGAKYDSQGQARKRVAPGPGREMIWRPERPKYQSGRSTHVRWASASHLLLQCLVLRPFRPDSRWHSLTRGDALSRLPLAVIFRAFGAPEFSQLSYLISDCPKSRSCTSNLNPRKNGL